MIKRIKNKTLLKLMAMVMVAFVGLTFTACGDDDDEGGSNALIGTWYLESYNGTYCTWGEYWKITSKEIKWNNRGKGTFNTTYSYTSTGSTLSIKCTYTSSGSTKDYDESYGTYKINGNTLTVTLDDGITRIFSKF